MNIAEEFRSPFRAKSTHHRNVVNLVTETVGLFRSIHTRSTADQQGLDVNTVIVVSHSNLPGDKSLL
jgi:hypothetical protein